MDPFGDDNAGELNNFQAPMDASSNDFFENDNLGSENGEGSAPVAAYSAPEMPPVSQLGAMPPPDSTRSSSKSNASLAAANIPEVNELTKFMAEYEQQIAQKAVEQEKVGVEHKEKAKAELAKFATERSKLKESKKAANRTQEQATLEKLEADLQSANPWERVVSLVDLELANARKSKKDKEVKPPSSSSSSVGVGGPASSKGDSNKNTRKQEEEDEDLTRMKQIFLQLKAEPLEKTRT